MANETVKITSKHSKCSRCDFGAIYYIPCPVHERKAYAAYWARVSKHWKPRRPRLASRAKRLAADLFYVFSGAFAAAIFIWWLSVIIGNW